MRGATKYLYAFDVEEIGTYASNLCTHAVEHVAKLLQVRFAGSIVNRGFSFGHHCGHDDVGGTRYGCFIQEHVGTLQVFPVDVEDLVFGIVAKLGAELLKAKKVGIHTPSADLISSRLG